MREIQQEIPFDTQEACPTSRQDEGLARLRRDRIFSCITARLLFLLLLIVDFLWGLYVLSLFIVLMIAACVTCFKVSSFSHVAASYAVSIRRASVCAVALFLALFSPGFGIMIACTYFLMYDKDGLEEVVPSSLQSQFKEFFTSAE